MVNGKKDVQTSVFVNRLNTSCMNIGQPMTKEILFPLIDMLTDDPCTQCELECYNAITRYEPFEKVRLVFNKDDNVDCLRGWIEDCKKLE